MTLCFRRLLRLELREVLRQPLTWAIFLLLFVAMLVGAGNGASRVAREKAILSGVATEQARAIRIAKAAFERYSKPSDLEIDYHRDPTDAFGYMNYFLVTHAVKPPLSLAAIATGEADLQPNQIRIDFTSIFPDAAYDPGSPFKLKLGAFDLAFVVIYLVPLGLIALVATRLTGEQDSGILRLIAAQPIAPRMVAGAKYLALTLVCTVAVLGGALAALALTTGLAAGWALPIAGAMLALWVMLWIALGAVVATFWRGAIGSITILVLVWAMIAVFLPAAAALTIDLVRPTPSRISYIDASREAMDGFYGDAEGIEAAWLACFPRYAASPEAIKSPEVKRFARDAYYREVLMPRRQAFEANERTVLGLGDALRLLSPAMVVDDAFRVIAGTDAGRHGRFIRQADGYSEQLRRFFEPLALQNAAFPHRPCSECPGRLNFERFEDVPQFVPHVDERPGLLRGLWACLYLVLAVAVAGLVARWRLRDWPAQD